LKVKGVLRDSDQMQGFPEYTLEEVASHNTVDDCWVVVNNLVLDVSQYLAKHPGGRDLIFRSAGLDVTRDFSAMFHSSRAKAKLEELCCGNVFFFVCGKGILLIPMSLLFTKATSKERSEKKGFYIQFERYR
jgi:predicted heme/steroid binding protein